MIIKILITLFVVFASSRAYLRYRDRALSLLGLILWVVVWAIIMVFAWWPAASDLIASSVGVGRGVDVLVYTSIVVIFYAVFRVYVKLEYLEHEITAIVRHFALKGDERDSKENK